MLNMPALEILNANWNQCSLSPVTAVQAKMFTINLSAHSADEKLETVI